MKFAPGQVVNLKSGGQPLTVIAVDEDTVECMWLGEEGDLFRESIPAIALELAFGDEDANLARDQETQARAGDEDDEDDEDEEDDEEDEEDEDDEDDDEEEDDEDDEDEEEADEEEDRAEDEEPAPSVRRRPRVPA